MRRRRAAPWRGRHDGISSGRSRRSSRGPATSTPRRLIDRGQRAFGEQFWGFWMLGGMSGGGMGFIFDPEVKGRGAGSHAGDHEPTKRQPKPPCRSRWSRWSTISRSTSAALGGVVGSGEGESGMRRWPLRPPLLRSSAAHAPRLLRHDRAGAAAPRSVAAFAGPPRRTGSFRRGLPHRIPSSPAWCRSSSTGCCPNTPG